jgi:peroxiredoxin
MVISRLASLCLILLAGCATIQTQQGQRLQLSDMPRGSKATVVYFWATQCPCVSRFQSRIESLADRYASQGVSFVAVSSNSDDSEAKIKEVSRERELKLPLFKDHNGALAEQLGARTTPTVVLVDAQGRTLFRGWLDNERFEGEPGRIPFLENAINDVLAEREVAQPSSPIYGCRITKRLR